MRQMKDVAESHLVAKKGEKQISTYRLRIPCLSLLISDCYAPVETEFYNKAESIYLIANQVNAQLDLWPVNPGSTANWLIENIPSFIEDFQRFGNQLTKHEMEIRKRGSRHRNL